MRARIPYRRAILGLCILAYFGTRSSQLVVMPLVPEITATFDVSTTAIGAALTGMWAAYALMQLPSGMFGDRFGERHVVVASLVVAGVGSALLAASPSFPVFAVVVVGLGAGVGLYYNAGTMLLARQFEDTGRAIGFHRVGGQLAGMVTPVVVAAVSARLGWRMGVLVGLAATVPILVLFARHVRPAEPRLAGTSLRERVDGSLVVRLAAHPVVRLLTVVAVVAEFVNMATMTFLPTYLIEARGMDVRTASGLFSAYFVVVGASQVIVGWLADRLGEPAATVLALLAGTIGYVTLVASSGAVVVAGIVLVGFAMAWTPPVQAQVLDTLGRDDRGSGFGLFRTAYVLLGSLGSVVVGYVVDVATWSLAVSLLAGLLLAAVPPTLLAGRRDRRGDSGR